MTGCAAAASAAASPAERPWAPRGLADLASALRGLASALRGLADLVSALRGLTSALRRLVLWRRRRGISTGLSSSVRECVQCLACGVLPVPLSLSRDFTRMKGHSPTRGHVHQISLGERERQMMQPGICSCWCPAEGCARLRRGALAISSCPAAIWFVIQRRA